MSPDLQLALNSVWLVVAAILVFFMQAGFALVESGMVRAKNAVNVIMKNYTDMCVGAIGFWAVGYGLMFGTNSNGWFGKDHFFLADAKPWDYSMMFFQMMFAATAATIVSGALAERIRFNAYLIGSLIITALIYPVFGSWAWNEGGWLKKMGFIDFAGSTVVHSVGAWCSLGGILMLGSRLGRFSTNGTPRAIPGHNLAFVALGGLILWFGWFGFNAGSTGEANAEIGKIALNTHLSATAAATAAILIQTLSGKVLLTSVVNASLGGLVAITAGCAYVEPRSAILIGLIAGVIVLIGDQLLLSFRIDDAVGAIPVHGFCGVWGTLAVAIFKTGPFEIQQLITQGIGVAVAFVWTFPLACLMYTGIGLFQSLRVPSIDEQRGLDYAEHKQVGYPEFQDQQLHAGVQE